MALSAGSAQLLAINFQTLVASKKISLAIFLASIFSSAWLLFSVQPLFAKIILPILGGSPSVWSVAMVFYQTTLLLGYCYAHILSRRLSLRNAALVHLCLLAIASLSLPLAIASGWEKPPVDGHYLWLFAAFAMSIGLPFFALSANGPLLQKWFSKMGHDAESNDPYFMYAASNLGSLLGLVLFVAFMEPMFAINVQTQIWSLIYVLLFLLVSLSVISLFIRLRQTDDSAATLLNSVESLNKAIKPIGWIKRFEWLVLAAIPTGLLVSVTSFTTTDIASAPFLWVLPLLLFLLTLIITFQRQPILPHKAMRRMHPLAVVVLMLCMHLPSYSYWGLQFAVHLGCFFIISMVCHGELARRRPETEHLTGFYLSLAAGGMIGGLFAGIISPNIFSTVVEYPLLIALSMYALFELRHHSKKAWKRAVIAGSAYFLLLAAYTWLQTLPAKKLMGLETGTLAFLLSLLIPAFIIIQKKDRLSAALVALVALVGQHQVIHAYRADDIFYKRGFFGVVNVKTDGNFRVISHGSTLHGAQRIDQMQEGIRPEPTTYYHQNSGPFAEVITAVQLRTVATHVGVVGLGAGTLSCYKNKGENWKFFEIDPLIVEIATDDSQFTFLRECGSDIPIILGDARLTIGDEPPGKMDLLILDAFSSDAIPTHLLTLEAIEMYLSKLKPDGAILLHISNRYVNLVPVVDAMARELNLSGAVRYGTFSDGLSASPSLVAILSPSQESISIHLESGWQKLPARYGPAWTDDHSNLLGEILRTQKQISHHIFDF